MKKTGKAIIYSLLLPQAIVHLILFIGFRNEDEAIRNHYIGQSVIFSLLGLFIGIFISARLQKPKKEPWFYFAGQLLSFGLFLVVALDKETPEEIRAKKFEHASDSYRYIYLDNDTLNLYLKPIQLAMAKLESQFDEPNSFLLTSYYVASHDTLISGDITHIYTVYPVYDIIEKDSLFSKIIVLNDSVYIEKFNADLRTDEEIQQIKLIPES